MIQIASYHKRDIIPSLGFIHFEFNNSDEFYLKEHLSLHLIIYESSILNSTIEIESSERSFIFFHLDESDFSILIQRARSIYVIDRIESISFSNRVMPSIHTKLIREPMYAIRKALSSYPNLGQVESINPNNKNII